MFIKIKTVKISACVIALSFMLAAGCYALGIEGAAEVSVRIDGQPFLTKEECFHGGVTYVPLRSFVNDRIPDVSVVWDGRTGSAQVRAAGLSMSVAQGKNYIEINGRCIASEAENLISDGVMYVPVRSLARALGMDVSWSAVRKTAYLSSSGLPLRGEEIYDLSDLYWLSHIINAEACTEPFTGKIAVGNVVLNRVASEYFPDTVKEVIFQSSNGIYQFSPVKNGTVYNEPSEESVLAAKACLEGYSVSDEIRFFIRESIAASKWVCENRTFVLSIGNHDFYS